MPIKMPKNLVKELQARDGVKAMAGHKMNDIYTKSFVDTNEELHQSSVDDSLSGTTGITAVIVGDVMYVANVGDSRAIIAREDFSGKLLYQPLSSDQTPYRKDERERIKIQVSPLKIVVIF